MDLSAHIVIAGMVGYLIWRLSGLVEPAVSVEPVAASPEPVERPVTHPTRTLRLCSRFGVERAEQVIHVADWPTMVVHAGVTYRPYLPTWSDFAPVAEYREA